jgi:DNA-binding MarR family transcriptional regulator
MPNAALALAPFEAEGLKILRSSYKTIIVMMKVGVKRQDAVEQVNAAIHALLLKLNLTRLGQWSEKLEDIHFLDLHLLSHAEHRPDDTVGEMRRVLQVPQSTLTSMIDRLEKRRLVRRAIHPKDKRSFRIELTTAGQEVQREHRRVEKLIAGRLLDALPDDRARQQFVRLLTAITLKLTSDPSLGRSV